MYVTTFYSFKGGVGRTMALVNTAVDLAQRGRRVLAVDFDLEAPGLDTFPILRPAEPTHGVVDFVQEYLDSGQAPDVRGFLGRSEQVENLWVMPSGSPRSTYATSFARIDWGALYEQHDGYLLIEDLKEQWRQAVQADYVLVDSRTGYTDTGGICTRQLPDAVTVLFFPNEQNLRGLTQVVGEIRSEGQAPRRRTIKTHFVMSNVPDLDDEDEILVRMKDRFQRDLSFAEEPLVVHRYESLSLLNQVVFAKDRPRSRLAREYAELADRILRGNLADREGALHYIRQNRRGPERHRLWRPDRTSKVEADTLKRIADFHGGDGEVLYELGTLAAESEFEQARSMFTRAIDAGHRTPDVYLARAQVRSDEGDVAGASEDALRVLDFDQLPVHIVHRAVRLATSGDTQGIEGIERSPALLSLEASDQLVVATSLERQGERALSAAVLARLAEDSGESDESRSNARSQLAVAHIEGGEFPSAREVLSRGRRQVKSMGIQDAFNYGMAQWAEVGAVVVPPFQRVVELAKEESDKRSGANYMQCLAVAHWAVGDHAAATAYANRAREEARTEGGLIFSCWQYRSVRHVAFLDDLNEICALIDGDETRVPQIRGFRAQPG